MGGSTGAALPTMVMPIFASLTAIAALEAQHVAHARCVVLIEACEESGSPDLPAHVEALAARIGTPSLVVCLDAEAGDYERLWLTTSLRGNVVGTLDVQVLTEGVHSGAGSGIAASCFDVLRELLSRISDERTGELKLDELKVQIPEERRRQIAATADVLADSVAERMPFAPGVQALSKDPFELLLNSTWKATLTVTGIDGLPAVRNAGNVLAPRLGVKLSFRLPPTANAAKAAEAIRRTLEAQPAVQGSGAVQLRCRQRRLERTAARVLVGASRAGGLPELFRPRRHVDGGRRHDSLHGHAGRAISRNTVPGHGRPWSAFQCAWPE